MIDLSIPTQPLAGQLHFIHYAFMPNRLQYCGGDDNRTLLEYGTAQVVDGGLVDPVRADPGAGREEDDVAEHEAQPRGDEREGHQAPAPEWPHGRPKNRA